MKKQAAPQRRIVAVLRCGKKMMDALDTWRYWEIVGALQWMGADRALAYEQAKYIQKAKPGDTWRIVPDISIEIIEKE